MVDMRVEQQRSDTPSVSSHGAETRQIRIVENMKTTKTHPAGQGEQVRAPVKLTIEPGAQGVQAEAPATFEN